LNFELINHKVLETKTNSQQFACKQFKETQLSEIGYRNSLRSGGRKTRKLGILFHKHTTRKFNLGNGGASSHKILMYFSKKLGKRSGKQYAVPNKIK
jgi:hypothetical protein